MLQNLKQFVPSEVCLKCDGCCRFKEETSAWRPKVTPAEIAQIKGSGLADEIFAKQPFGTDGHIKAVPCQGGHQCSFFHPDGNTCGIYQQRPFECQLYPFILSEDKDKPAIFVHLNCPFVQETRYSPEFDGYTEYLKAFFARPETMDFISRSPSLIGDYSQYRDELEYVFTVDLA